VEDLLAQVRRGAATRDLLVQEHNSVLQSLRQAVQDKENERRLTAARLEDALLKARTAHASSCSARDEYHRLQLENVLARSRLDKDEAAQKERRLREERDAARADADRLRAQRDHLSGELLALKAQSSEQAVRTAVSGTSGPRGPQPSRPRTGQ